MRESDPKLTRFARKLRREQMDQERILWSRLRARKVGGPRFRRQHPIGPYIVDFCCPEMMLVVELDGGQHADQETEDQERTRFLESQGYRVIRFWNNQVVENLEGVLEKIWIETGHPHPNPLPGRERE